ncbi:MAG TPA: hypothetical protein VKA55_09495 [Gammaproteobacteria bacterium]|nr:hypothetical protein [Gammaproteobacteria bacterium]
MRYSHGVSEAVLATQAQAANSHQPADGPGGITLVLVTIALLVAVSLLCHSASSRSSRSDRNASSPSRRDD